MRRIAGEVRDAMAQNPDVRDPHLQWNEMAPSIRLVVDQDRARALGLAPQDIAQTLQTLVSGLPVTEMRDGTDLVQVVARAVPGERLDVAGLGDLTVASRERRGGAAGAGGAHRAGGGGADPLAAEPRAGDRGPRRHPRRRAGAGRDQRDPAGARADQGGAAGGLPDRDRRRDRGEREGQRLDLQDVPDHAGGDADHPDDPAAELRAGRDRAARPRRSGSSARRWP